MCTPCVDRGGIPEPFTPGGVALGPKQLLRQLDAQADDPSERRDVAYVETRNRLSAGDVRDSTQALEWLGDHTRVTEFAAEWS
jgi:hypothetical protein